MALRMVFCPECGQQIQVDDSKAFCFCPQCGRKIPVSMELPQQSIAPQPGTVSQPEALGQALAFSPEIDRKLEEAAFYYQLSQEKEEAFHQEEPKYYLKAQDLLVDLSEQYPEDYRIWWELCKPVDFWQSSQGTDAWNQYSINEYYFGKALDYAGLPEKRKLITEHDRYVERKKAAWEAEQQRQREAEARCLEQERILAEKKAEEQRILEEQRAKEQRILEEQRAKEQRILEERQAKERRIQEQKRIEEERIRKQEAERKEKERKKQEEERLRKDQEAQRIGAAANAVLWKALYEKNYVQIDNMFFVMDGENGQSITVVLKKVSNVMYLLAFRSDPHKGNAVYKEQTLSIQFNEQGQGVRFDNTLVRVKGIAPPNDVFGIYHDGRGSLWASGMKLQSDLEYVSGLVKRAKKPLLSFSKIFV